MKKISLYIIAVLILQACNMGETKFKPHGQPGVFQMQVPDYLTTDTSMDTDANSVLSSEQKGVYISVLHENRDTLISYGHTDINLAGYLTLVKENHAANGQLLKEISEKAGTVNGMKCIEMMIEYDVSAENNGVKTFALGKLMIIEGKKNFFQLFVWCNKDDFEKYSKDFEKAISSFKEL